MKTKYITPRLAIATITSHQDIHKLTQLVESRHKHYHHYFNLTIFKLAEQKQSPFKWRGLPFSLTQTIKILTQIDTFLRINIANAAILCVSSPIIEQFALFLAKTYLQILALSVSPLPHTANLLKMTKTAENILQTHPHLSQQITQIYKNIQIAAPPLKILAALTIQPPDLFIPIVQVHQQSRYNEFQIIYLHPIEEQLATYYLNLDRPLDKGIGKKYYDQKPETKYFKKPVVVSGDVKIIVYSYKCLKKIHQFTIGFNTLNIDAFSNKHQGTLVFSDSDLYEKNKDTNTPITVELQFTNYCDNPPCQLSASCPECKQSTKKITTRYSESQSDLQKLHRTRTLSQVNIQVSL